MLFSLLLLSLFGFTFTADDISASFTCNFERDDCGIVEVPGYIASWERKKMNVGGRDGYVLALQPSGKDRQTGRAMTPKFELDNMTMSGCLTFDLYVSGFGVLFLQSENAEGMNTFKVIGGETNGWSSVSTSVRIIDYITFYFEGKIDPSAGSVLMALDNFVFELNAC